MEKSILSKKRAVLLKGFLILILTLVLLIPLLLVGNLVDERQGRQHAVNTEIGEKWGKKQVIKGPVLVIHITMERDRKIKDSSGNIQTQTDRYPAEIYLTPDSLLTEGNLMPEVRKRSIFSTVVYEADLKITGQFGNLKKRLKGIDPASVRWQETELLLGISDLRGLKVSKHLEVNGSFISFKGSGNPDRNFGAAIKASVPLRGYPDSLNFDLSLQLKGSEMISFVPLAKENHVALVSVWDDPRFEGAFLPDSRTVSKSGFEADWSVSHLNRNLPETWNKNASLNYTESEFGVSLIQPNDHYQKTGRAIKYGILVIGLTYLSLFFVELISGQTVHPFQYVLIGLALCIFYALLLSFSEFLYFNLAYLLSALLILGMTGLYTRSVLIKGRLSSLITAVLIALYVFIFSIIQLEDTALLAGSLGLFIILSITMYFSRKVDWENF